MIGDFGISNQMMKGKVQEYVTTNQGTQLYLAPEIYQGDKFKLEPDIFAYGIILYELLTGKRPFIPMLFKDISEIICKGEYEEKYLERVMCDSVNRVYLIELIRGCLEIDRKKRLNIWDVLGNIYYIYIYIYRINE